MEVKILAGLLQENELLIADMYRECARFFPDFKDEFMVFVDEEESHARMFARMKEDMELNPGQWRPGRMSVRTLEIVQQQIKHALDEIRSGHVAPRYAITALRNFEQGMSERAADKIFETDSPVFRQEIEGVRDGFVGHLTRLQELEMKIFPRSGKKGFFEI